MGKIKYRPPRGLLKELRKIADAYIEKVGGAWIMVLPQICWRQSPTGGWKCRMLETW